MTYGQVRLLSLSHGTRRYRPISNQARVEEKMEAALPAGSPQDSYEVTCEPVSIAKSALIFVQSVATRVNAWGFAITS